MPTNNFKLFDENKTNILTDVEYASNTQRQNGVQTGVASSKLNNKFSYQTSLVAYAIAQIMNANGKNASDADAVATFVANLQGSLVQKVLDCASSAEAIAGVINNKYITPATMKAAALLLAGGTMTGPLYLSRDPVEPLEAATKQWVEEGIDSEKDQVGDVRSSLRSDLGSKYVLADGSELDATQYPDLAKLITGGSFEQSTVELAATINASFTESPSFINFTIVNGLYCVICSSSNSNKVILLVTDNPEGTWTVRTFDSGFYSFNISYCNGYYVMVGNDTTYYSASNNQKIIIAYTMNPLTTPFTMKTLTHNDTTFYWSCTNTNMVYFKGKYHIICNLYYTDDKYRSYYIGTVYSDSIDGEYTYFYKSGATDVGTGAATVDEENGVVYLISIPTSSGYQGNYGISAYSDLTSLTSSGGFTIKQSNSTITTAYYLGEIFKLNSGKWIAKYYDGSIRWVTFNPGTTPTKISDIGALSYDTWAHGKNNTSTGSTAKDLFSYYQSNLTTNNIKLINISNNGATAQNFSNVTWKDTSLSGVTSAFVSLDGNTIYFFCYINNTYVVRVYKLPIKSFLPTITINGCNTFIRALP